ncbi:CusA/CzcA family heavy metal efflux RND transporter [uncultured Umboniibacter sp.]|uniref:efflux RND transporter permease subunit n=1 Tax=uncultured Umboniibacter sp. TaxID=1798917 RepID=UPI00261291F0|nr:CusA/CzcA family heavy metal efflux RND transporter [uncultured Umboniibacter sp.]
MINSLIRAAISQRALIMGLSLLSIALGVWGYQRLAIDAVPDITNVQIQINTEAPGYSPLETEQQITFPIETALYGLPNLEYTRSLSRYGLSQVTVIFKDGTNIYDARNLVDQKLGSIKSAIPAGLEPQMGPIATGLGEIFMYVVEANEGALDKNLQPYNSMALREIQDWIIRPQLAQVPGVVEVNTLGGFDKQYQISPNPQRMLEHGVSLADLTDAVRDNNSNRGAGFVEHNGQQLLVRSPGQLNDIAAIGSINVSTHDSIPLQIDDIASVHIGEELRSGAATTNGTETVMGIVLMLLNENAKQVASDLSDRVADIQTSLPNGVSIKVVYNRTELVEQTISTVQHNLMLGALLVIAVLFTLLGNLRAALITAAVIPLSMLATLFGMVEMGISANLMSLGALDFGLIVDGAVIIVENCVRRLSQSNQALAANTRLPLNERLKVVYEATTEVIHPALFGVVIITVVYIPIFALDGVEGKMFHPMAITVILALIAAIILSVTFVPAAVALFMGNRVVDKEYSTYSRFKAGYHALLGWVLKGRILIVSLASAAVVAAVMLASTLGSEFVPQLDEGDITMHAMRIPGTSLSQSIAMQQLLERELLKVPEVERVFTRIGTADVATDPMPPNVTDTFLRLKPREQWPNPELPKAQLISHIETVAAGVPGNNYEFTQPIQMRFNELISGVRSDIGIKVFGDDLEQLLATANDIEAQLAATAGATDIRVEAVTGLPLLSINPKRSQLARYGLSVNDLQDFVAATIGGQVVGQVFEGDRRFDLVIRLSDEVRLQLDQLGMLPLTRPDGGYVPLQEVATLEITSTPAQISRENGKRRIVITANVRDRDLGSFVAEARDNISTNVDIPAGYWLNYDGTFQQLESATTRLAWVVPLTLAIIFAILMLAFNSTRTALVIFSGIPLALTGGILALWLRDIPLSISAGVGFIALSGVAVLNGLVMVSFIRTLQQQGMSIDAAIIEGAATRLRPVLMTALVASLGFIPMALNTDIGAEVQRPLATVVIGGIISSTLLTLVVLPALYRLFNLRKPAI